MTIKFGTDGWRAVISETFTFGNLRLVAQAIADYVREENGAVVKGDSVEVQYMLTKGTQSTHVHAYVDGQYQKGFSGVIKGLTLGKHEIKVVAANHDHKTLAAEAVVTVDVQ